MCPFRGSLRQTLPSPRRFISHPLLPLNTQETAAPWNPGPWEQAGPSCCHPILCPSLQTEGLRLPAPSGGTSPGIWWWGKDVAGLQASGTSSLTCVGTSFPASPQTPCLLFLPPPDVPGCASMYLHPEGFSGPSPSDGVMGKAAGSLLWGRVTSRVSAFSGVFNSGPSDLSPPLSSTRVRL